MANALYPLAREGFLAGEIDWDTAVIKAVLVRGYTYSAAHKFMSDIATGGGTLTGTPPTLATKTVALGVADAADISFTAVAANAANHALLVYQASAVTGGSDVANTAQRLIAFFDTGTNFPIIPNGGDVAIAWDNGSNRIFVL